MKQARAYEIDYPLPSADSSRVWMDTRAAPEKKIKQAQSVVRTFLRSLWRRTTLKGV